MTQPAATMPTIGLSRFGLRDLGLWAGAATLVLMAHGAIAYGVQSWSPADTLDGGPPPALMIEMAPMVVTPAIEEQAAMLEAAVPDQTEPVQEAEKAAEAEPTTEPEKPVEQAETAPPDETEPTQPAVAQQADQQPLDEVVPDVVEAIAPDVVIPLPQPKPVDVAKEKKSVEVKVKKPVEKPKPRPKKEKAVTPKTVTVASADAKAAAKTAAPKASEASARSGVSPANWKSQLRSWINRHTRYPSAARSRRAEGNVNVTFRVDASGKVSSARISSSSGDADLDRAALAVLQGATVPKPPPEIAGTSVGAPFVFNLRN
ncbi:energy transducer TonB [Mesorhizobium sp. INR15]|uniref:energy transducer TonB family protein n=1 Tax=Mesorhizobium sp. INR15 TaxID=2654248 RepID=UPI0018968B7B|nr:energy transducer TonB [Mesorhizobium sp. INR15]QPC90227.1 TonB family protein [Mesorhizobium sp. INR15]